MFDRWSTKTKAVGGTALGVAALVAGVQFATTPKTIQGWGPVGQGMAVDVKGAVAHPGLYKFGAGARIDDALKAAGGPAQDASLDSLNLAQLLEDGMEVRVPRVGDPASAPVVHSSKPSSSSGRSSGSGKKQMPVGKIAINSASEKEFEQLPGVGPATAKKILEYRTQAGGFKSIDEIQKVKGIGPKKFAQMQAYLSL